MEKVGSVLSENTNRARALFLEKKSAYFTEKTEEAWDAYTNAYYAWIDAVCDDISAEHNQMVFVREGRRG